MESTWAGRVVAGKTRRSNMPMKFFMLPSFA
jgi:hypothetical protein